MGIETARMSRMGRLPDISSNQKFITKTVWLNNNKLTSIKGLDGFLESILEEPSEVGWIDFSYNNIVSIDDVILKYNKLKILYFHGNNIKDIDEVMKLRNLPELRSITFHGNSVVETDGYRDLVVAVLPQVCIVCCISIS